MRVVLAIFFAATVCFSAETDPMVIAPSDDTYLSATHTGKPGGRGESKEFQIYGNPDHKQFRALLKFDLAEVKRPPSQAILRVHAWNVGSPKKSELIRCHPILRDWNEKHASWDQSLADDQWMNAGGDFDTIAVSGSNINAQMSGEKGYWLEFDVTPLVQAWVLKRRPNHGVAPLFDP